MTTTCTHQCAKACLSMENALRQELEMAMHYRDLLSECDFPEVKSFFQTVLEAHESLCRAFNEKLSELKAERDITEQIGAMF